MKKFLHIKLVTFFIFVSSLIGLSNSNAQTGTVSASPENVTEYTNLNGSGNTTISWSTQSSPRTLITLTKTKQDGTLVTAETLVIKNNLATGTVVANYIQKGIIHTFKLYTGVANSDVLGAPLATVIVTGVAPAATGILTATPQNVTEFTNLNGSGNTVLSWSTANSPRTLISLTKTKKDGTTLAAETLVIKNNTATNPSFPINYIQKDIIHTFKLYTGVANSDVLGALLATYIVYGYDPALGINNEKRDNEGVTVSNDPFTNQFRIHIIDRKASTVELSVFDISGKMISASKIIRADTDFMYDASTIQKGVYLLKIILDNNTQLVRKIIKI
jgi:hypothetical protein